jgi:hypothetical protein
MKTNMGKVDRSIRIVVAVAIAALYFSNIITGTLGIGLLIVAVAFVLTSFVGFCPLYFPFGISTYRDKKTGSV